MEISKIRTLMKHEFHRGSTTRQAVININKVFGFQVTTNATVARWFKKFRSGDFGLAYEPRGRPKTQVDNAVLKATVDANPSISARELAVMYNVSKQTILTHLAQIGKVKILGKWVDPVEKPKPDHVLTQKEENTPVTSDKNFEETVTSNFLEACVEDIKSELNDEDPSLSSKSLKDFEMKKGESVKEKETINSTTQNRSSRRKSAAPQRIK